MFAAHVKLSKVFHWAGLSDTLTKDLRSGGREGLLSNSFPAAAVMGDPCRCGNCGAKGGAVGAGVVGWWLKAPSVQTQIQCFRSRAEWVLSRSILS